MLFDGIVSNGKHSDRYERREEAAAFIINLTKSGI
jgi:hypothetical protein